MSTSRLPEGAGRQPGKRRGGRPSRRLSCESCGSRSKKASSEEAGRWIWWREGGQRAVRSISEPFGNGPVQLDSALALPNSIDDNLELTSLHDTKRHPALTLPMGIIVLRDGSKGIKFIPSVDRKYRIESTSEGVKGREPIDTGPPAPPHRSTSSSQVKGLPLFSGAPDIVARRLTRFST